MKAANRNISNKYFDELLFSISSPLVALLIIHVEEMKTLDNGMFQSYFFTHLVFTEMRKSYTESKLKNCYRDENFSNSVKILKLPVKA